MTKRMNVIASFFSMLCLGGIYAWSVFVPSLKADYGLSGAQTQLVFGCIIAFFSLSMIWAGTLEQRIGAKKLTMISALLFFLGYSLSGLSTGNFFLILLGIGVFSGIATGLGYLMALTIPVKWFPEKKGVIAGIAAAGFGGGAVVVTLIAQFLFSRGLNALNIFLILGILFGFILLIMAYFYSNPDKKGTDVPVKPGFLKEKEYLLLLVTLFCGTFSGLMVIGNLKPMGLIHGIPENILAITIILFSIANFTGRVIWGWLSDIFHNSILVLLAFGMLGISTVLIGFLPLNSLLFLFLALITGFAFGSNFVLFARETAQIFGVTNVSKVYPWVFLGYGIAGITGPLAGGWLSDIFGNYQYASLTAAIISIGGGLFYYFIMKNNKT